MNKKLGAAVFGAAGVIGGALATPSRVDASCFEHVDGTTADCTWCYGNGFDDCVIIPWQCWDRGYDC
jgi:hypothetical protein